MAYLISMTVRINLIWHKLKKTGSFYLHCDPTASHYLKIICDSIFCGKERGGNYLNDIIWKRYAVHSLSVNSFDRISDNILFYIKRHDSYVFNLQYENIEPEQRKINFPHLEIETNRYYQHVALEQSSNFNSDDMERVIQGRTVVTNLGWRWTQETFDSRIAENPHLIYWTRNGKPRYKLYFDEDKGKPLGNIWNDIPYLSSGDKERLGYPTQKPEALLERIINASTNEGDVILDAFCGCGTTVSVAQKLNRQWMGIDITYQSISLILKRLEDTYGQETSDNIILHGVPKDMDSAKALAHKKDDRVRKQFEMWAILTYTNNAGIINDKKGADGGVDGIVSFGLPNDRKKAIISVKSGKNVGDDMVNSLIGVVQKNDAECGILILLEEPTKVMKKTAEGMGTSSLGKDFSQTFSKIKIVTIKEILEENLRIDLPLVRVHLKEAKKTIDTENDLFNTQV